MEHKFTSIPIAKNHFETGHLKGFSLYKKTMPDLLVGSDVDFWNVLLITDKEMQIWLSACNKINSPRNFKSINAAINALEKIGFKVEEMGYLHGARK